jgi:hypothetical protein
MAVAMPLTPRSAEARKGYVDGFREGTRLVIERIEEGASLEEAKAFVAQTQELLDELQAAPNSSMPSSSM